MQDEHGFVWKAMLDAVDGVDGDMAGSRVLDVGCNRGGFLRLAADRWGIAEGSGYDPTASPPTGRASTWPSAMRCCT
jgi:hypothetical protein